jgi:hypothetical protein
MAKLIRVTLEMGPKGKKVVAVAPDWPGLERGAATGEAATERLLAYIPRYAVVAKLAGKEAEYKNLKNADVVDQYPGTGSTDFWGISYAFSSIDRQTMSAKELEREITLMQACWTFFDSVRSRVSTEMKRGPRGGGRDRDQIVHHVIANEMSWAKMLGLPAHENVVLTDEVIHEHREAYCQAIRDYHSEGKMAGKVAKWPLRYLIRHTAYHTLDHAWEMEDKDLTNAT